MLIDCHNHSIHSFDGSVPVAKMCEAAKGKGIDVFALTDHCDVTEEPQEHLLSCIESAYDEIFALKEKMPFTLLAGVELGQAMNNPSFAEKIMSCRPFDFVIASVHDAKGISDFYFLDYDALSDEELFAYLNDYIDRLFWMVQWGKGDTLAHITYPFRYLAESARKGPDPKEFLPRFRELFSLLVKREMALEVNTSGLRQKIGKTLPDEFLLTEYYACGGRLITIGSDAHYIEDMGKGIPETLEKLKEIGFTEISYFEKRNRKALLL